MGAGKSRIGRLVAQRLGVPFVDTDEVISARHGAIADLFAEHGEEGFRAIEREVVLDELGAAEQGARVVALGGGAVTIDEVRAALRRLPHVVWLDAPPRVLFARTRTSARPLARDEAALRGALRGAPPPVRRGATQVVRTAGHERLAWVADKVLAAVAA